MLYSTELAKDPTFEDIIAKVTEYDVFKFYMGSDFKLNQIMSSPLRDDKHPSFGIFKSNKTGQLLFKDQASGISGNCVCLVSNLYALTYFQALKKIWYDMILGRVNVSEKGKTIEKLKPITTTILVQRRNFSKFDDAYWNQFEIYRNDLKEFNVFPIEQFWINDSLQSMKYESDSPMYAYQIFNKFKIYKPLASKEDKWRSNAGLYDIQGYEQLPDKCDHIIITKALKDIIVLRKLGYYAIAPNGENHTIPEVIINKLRKDKGTTKFTIFYDNDEAGKMASSKLLNKYPDFNLIEILGSSNTFSSASYDTGAKDISDYVKLYGLNKAKEWMQENIIGQQNQEIQ